MASREELLSSIQPEMKLSKNFFIRIYGYEITWSGFADQALTELEKLGCSKAREYYQRFIDEYEKEHEEMMKRVAVDYRKQVFEKKKEVRNCKENLTNMSNKDLLMYLGNLIEGV